MAHDPGPRRLAIFAATMALLAPAVARAQDAPAPAPAPPPDKSGFSLFDVTPTADLRSFCTDRPTKSTSPCTVDAGHWQIESDLVNVTIDRSGGLDTTTWLVTNPTLKVGLTNTLEAELNIAPYEIVTVRDRASGVSTRMTGVGDLFAKLEWNLIGDDGGAVAFALSPFVKIPTASHGLGNGAVEAGMIAPINVNLPANWSLTIDPEVDLLENAAGDGRHANVSGLLSLSRPVSKQVTLSAEIWSDIDFDPVGRRTQYSSDFGAAWIPRAQPNLQFDCGVNFGLNRETPPAQIYLGVSRRF